MMGEIYSSAMLVLAWFGKQTPLNGTLTEAVSCLQDWQASQEYRDLLLKGSAQSHQPSRTQQAPVPALLSLAEPYGSVWSCLTNLCHQTYWTRLWIVQELVKAKELLLMWGDEQIPWNVLSAALHTIQFNNLHIRTSEARFAPWDVIAHSAPFQVWLQRDGTRPEQSLLELMETYHRSDCSVPHDKAYALTGISTDSQLIQVDYHESLPDLYVNLMKLVPDRTQCARYSHLILGALGLDSRQLLSGSGMTPLRGKTVDCSARRVGKVEATKAVDIRSPSINVEADIFELLLMASAMLTTAVIDSLSLWAQSTHKAFQYLFQDNGEKVMFFWLSSNQLGAALSPVPIGHCVYRLPGINDSDRDLYIRVEDGEHPDEFEGSSPTGIDSPQISSPTKSCSTFFSEPGAELASRVWVSDIAVPQAQAGDASASNLHELVTIQVSLTDLVVLNKMLEVDIESTEEGESDLLPEMRRERRQTHSHMPRRRGTRDSASISDAIDEAMRRPSTGLVRTSTWPTQTAGAAFIDALSRNLRDKLFTSPKSSLNLPD